MAATCNFPQASARLYGDGPRSVADQTRSLQFCRRNGNGGPACSQRPGNAVLSKVKDACAYAVLHHEKPAVESLDKWMAVIADSQIRDFLQQTLKVGQRGIVKRVVLFEVFAKDSGLGAYRASRNLNKAQEGSGFAQKIEYSGGSIMSNRLRTPSSVQSDEILPKGDCPVSNCLLPVMPWSE